METVFFWTAWGFISVWALKTFYYSYQEKKLEKLRLTGFWIEVSVLILFFLPWLPETRGGKTAITLIQEGQLTVIALFLLILVTAICFLTKNNFLLKTGALSHLFASVLIFVVMLSLSPGTDNLTLNHIAPIIAVLLLLAGNVIVLITWQQINLKQTRH